MKSGSAASSSDRPLSQEELEHKIRQYEEFINDRLKADLQKLLEQRDLVYEDAAEYTRTADMVEGIQAADTSKPLKMQVDIGNGFFANARVPDPSMINISVGFGLHVELTLDEAKQYCRDKARLLERKADGLTQRISRLKALISVAMEGLRELQGL